MPNLPTQQLNWQQILATALGTIPPPEAVLETPTKLRAVARLEPATAREARQARELAAQAQETAAVLQARALAAPVTARAQDQELAAVRGREHFPVSPFKGKRGAAPLPAMPRR